MRVAAPHPELTRQVKWLVLGLYSGLWCSEVMSLPADVKKALLAVLADQNLCTEVRQLLDIEESERSIMQVKEIVEAKQINLTGAELGSSANMRWLGGLLPPSPSPPVYFPN